MVVRIGNRSPLPPIGCTVSLKRFTGTDREAEDQGWRVVGFHTNHETDTDYVIVTHPIGGRAKVRPTELTRVT